MIDIANSSKFGRSSVLLICYANCDSNLILLSQKLGISLKHVNLIYKGGGRGGSHAL